MNSEEKYKYIRKKIKEALKSKINNSISFDLYPLVDCFFYDENGRSEEFFTIEEQKAFLRKLEVTGKIKKLQFNGEKNVSLEIIPKKKNKTRRSNVFSHIKNTDQFIQNRELLEKFLNIIGNFKDIKPYYNYTLSTNEENDDLIQFLIDLELIEYDWNELKKQKHRPIGNRLIEFSFDGYDIVEIRDRISGINGCIGKKILEIISKDIASRLSSNEIIEILSDIGVPQTMFAEENDSWNMVFYILSYYATGNTYTPNYYMAGNKKDILMLLKILEQFIDPFSFSGDEEKAIFIQEKYNKYLKLEKDNRIILNNGNAYIGPTEEEDNISDDLEWMNSDGILCGQDFGKPDAVNIAELFVLWQQIILVTETYENKESINREVLEKLYYETIEKTEELIRTKYLGRVRQKYKRPFTSLSTAKVEALTKKTVTPSQLLGDFLQSINNEDINMFLVNEAKEKNKELIERVVFATKNTFINTKYQTDKKDGGPEKKLTQNKFVISVMDREIKINNWLISKPHPTGSNFEFFEYIRQNRNTKITRDTLPSTLGALSLKETTKDKSFIKILNGLGFKGEILKAFFYDRGKDTITYRGDEITKKDLMSAGVNISIFLMELKLVNKKRRPD